MMALAPASASISAEMSPVWAPEAFGWQSWAPTASFEPRALSAKAGDQGRRRADQQVGLAGQRARPGKHCLEFAQSGLQAVHFPVAGDQRPDGVGHVNYPANVSVMECASRARAASSRYRSDDPPAVNRFNWPTRARLRGGGRHFMMRFQLGDALLRNSIPDRISLGTTRFPSPAKQVGPMLRGMRKASSNWLGKIVMAIVMGVLIVSFAVWGIADIFKGFGQSTLAKVGRTEISTEQFRQIYTDKLQQLGRQFGRPLTSEQARAFGLDRQVLQQTIAEAALDEEARRMGLAQSEDETMRHDLQRSQFQGIGRRSSTPHASRPRSGSSATPNSAISPSSGASALRRQIAGTISAGLEPPKVLIDALTRFQNEQRSIEYVKLDAAQAGTIDPPSPETLAAYFDDHKTQFRAPEYRKLSFVVINPGRDRQMDRGLRRGRQEDLRAEPRQARHAGKARSLADRVSRTQRKRWRRAAASRRERRSTISPRSAISIRPTSTSA